MGHKELQNMNDLLFSIHNKPQGLNIPLTNTRWEDFDLSSTYNKNPNSDSDTPDSDDNENLEVDYPSSDCYDIKGEHPDSDLDEFCDMGERMENMNIGYRNYKPIK